MSSRNYPYGIPGRDELEVKVEGSVLTCRCGQKSHVSLFREALEATAREAYRLGRMGEPEAIHQAIEAGYGRVQFKPAIETRDAPAGGGL